MDRDVTKLPGGWLIPSQGEWPGELLRKVGVAGNAGTRWDAYHIIVYFKLISWCALLSASLRERQCYYRIPFRVCLKGKPGLSLVLSQL